MEKASISDLKNKLSAYLKKVVAGNPVMVLDRDRPIAILERVKPDDADDRLMRLERAGLLRRGNGESSVLPALTSIAESSVVEALIAERREGR